MQGTVLVVDDEPSHRRLLRLLLEEAGYAVELAADGVQALQVLERSSVQVMLLDLHMPRMDGRECAARLGARGSHLPLVLMSTDGEVRAWAREVPQARVLAKPFKAAELLSVVQAVGACR
jgi:CheY-like chemotaxis protein